MRRRDSGGVEADCIADAQQKVMFRAFSWSAASKAEFVPVQTGITGVTDIEVTSGLQEGDQIVIGKLQSAAHAAARRRRSRWTTPPPKRDESAT